MTDASQEGTLYPDCVACGGPLVCKYEESLAAWNRYNPVIESLRAQLIIHGIVPDSATEGAGE